jgi:hypothetical protein
MGRGIVKLADGEYVEWSTVVDAPVSYVLGADEARAAWGEERVERADERGTSFVDLPPTPAAEYVAGNRAGDGEEELTLDEIRARYAKEVEDGGESDRDD